MKKTTFFSYLATLAIILWTGWTLNAQQVQIGNGTEEGKHVPIEPYYGYSYSQQIYLASQIGVPDGGTITEIKFQFNQPNATLENSNEWEVYIGHTSKTEFVSDTDWVAVSELTLVFDGTIPASDAEGWITVDIDDWAYNGTDNLLIAVNEKKDDYDSSSDDFYAFASTGTQSIVYYNDYNPFDPANPASANATQNYLANIILVGIEPACPSPENLTYTINSPTETTLQWDAGDATEWEVEYGEAGIAPGEGTVVTVTTPSYTITGLDAITSYTAYVRTVCDNDLRSTDAVINWVQNDNCNGIANLDDYTSPVTSSTEFAQADYTASCITSASKDVIFQITVPAGKQLTIGQSTNDYDSKVYVGYGGSCPGETEIDCFDDPDTQEVTWVNDTGSDQVVYWLQSGYGSEAGEFTLEWEITCPEPTDLNVSVSTTTAELSWTDNTNGSGSFVLQWKSTADTDWNEETVPAGTTTYTLSDLTEGEYVWQVKTVCSDGSESAFVEGPAFTICEKKVPEYVEEFENWPPQCWEEARGEEGAELSYEDSSWTQDDFANDPDKTKAARVNLWNASHDEWLISPVFDLSGGTYNVSFDVAVTTYSGTDPVTMPADDFVKFKVSTDDGATWTDLMVWDSNNTPSNTGEEVTIDLSAYSQDNVKFAFFATDGDTDDTEDYNFYVDNFRIADQLNAQTVTEIPNGFYPNPVEDVIYFNPALDVQRAEITTLNGQILYSGKVAGNKLNVQNMEKGIYLLRIWTENQAAVYKLIKQ